MQQQRFRSVLFCALIGGLLLASLVAPAARVAAASSPSSRHGPNPEPTNYVSCDFTKKTPLSKQCQQVQALAVAARQRAGVTPDTTNCWDGSLAAAKQGSTAFLSAQLDWYTHGSGNYCFYFFSISQNNDPDFDDSWFAQIRMWVCGTITEFATQHGVGPPAWVQTSTRYYAGCGPQADDYNSYAVIEGDQHYFPYLNF